MAKFLNNIYRLPTAKLALVVLVLLLPLLFGVWLLLFNVTVNKQEEFSQESFPNIPTTPTPTATASPSPTPIPSPTPWPISAVVGRYPVHKNVIASVFWVGEGATDDNAGIHNGSSAWKVNWEESFGGVDDPEDRNGYYPAGFTPRENPFYFALPYNDLQSGRKKENATKVYWYTQNSGRGSILKNRWIKVTFGDKTCYGQWADVGPMETDDVDYVFGNAHPKNTWGLKAGIDLSPAFSQCLGVRGVGNVDWQFVDVGSVPSGPWREIITK